uniref:MSP domain-containing protein n=1 Tax=Steinernema glaseri TaxID=37863 RepID=A0A1I7YQM4_9BILA
MAAPKYTAAETTFKIEEVSDNFAFTTMASWCDAEIILNGGRASVEASFKVPEVKQNPRVDIGDQEEPSNMNGPFTLKKRLTEAWDEDKKVKRSRLMKVVQSIVLHQHLMEQKSEQEHPGPSSEASNPSPPASASPSSRSVSSPSSSRSSHGLPSMSSSPSAR